LIFKTFWVYALILCCLGSPSRSAGIHLLDSSPGLPGAIWYPCAEKPQSVPLGSLTMQFVDSLQGVKDCPVTGTKLPLVIVSHGRGGWFGGHADVAEALADAGFVVAAVNHPGDNGNDRSQSDSLSILTSRPADIIRLLDFMLDDWRDRAVIDHAKIGFFGSREGLAEVQIPLLIWRSELGGGNVDPKNTAITANSLPGKPEIHTLPAGHFAFLAPCSPQFAASLPRLCTDPLSFDRTAFHRDFDASIVRFFREHLVGDGGTR
jgi:predicted dienelactone hydrolase